MSSDDLPTPADATAPAPGSPGVPNPQLDEPTEPVPPAPPHPDQSSPELVTATGGTTGAPAHARAQHGAYLTTSTGVRLLDTDHSLKVGPRGPTLLQDHHLREKISHFDHERIPERVVHARGAAARGTFVANGEGTQYCRAGFLRADTETPVFVRFSTVLGSRGSADTVRDTRGFATKFYTDEGNFDLVGNNIPVFFIQDGIKFPDVVHAAKPHPDREIPQAQSAHDTFWDFVSLHTEAQHHTLWNMSDRGIPRSYRTMEGFGVHTFRLSDESGATVLAKFHWKPRLGVHSLVWEEAQLLNGMDPDFHRRDLADAIEAGAFPQWDLGLQVFADTEDQFFEGIDLLDPTKLVPEELSPVIPVGTLTLDANPTNYFAETEQVAFHVGNLAPGIDPTDDPLLAARLFSYLDTQITRLGGPNFNQLPVNRPQAPVNDMLRDGFHQHAVHGGVAPYRPNSLDGGCPFHAGAADGAYVEAPVQVPAGRKVREVPASYDDHFSQARLFWLSMSPVEQAHIVAAYTFELAKCYEEAIRVRQLSALAQIDDGLAAQVAAGLGLDPPDKADLPDETPSPALSQLGGTWPVDGRVVGVLVGPRADPEVLTATLQALDAAGTLPLVIAPVGGRLPHGQTVHRTLSATRSVEFDALVVLDLPAAAPTDPPVKDAKQDAGDGAVDGRVRLLLGECLRHAKAIAAIGADVEALEAAGVDSGQPGVVVGQGAEDVVPALVELLAAHRVWDRAPA